MLAFSGHGGSLRGSWEVITMAKKVLTWAVVVFIVYYLATNPTGAAHFVHGVYNWLRGAGHSMSTFVNSL
jgi:hypothetical protein